MRMAAIVQEKTGSRAPAAPLTQNQSLVGKGPGADVAALIANTAKAVPDNRFNEAPFENGDDGDLLGLAH